MYRDTCSEVSPRTIMAALTTYAASKKAPSRRKVPSARTGLIFTEQMADNKVVAAVPAEFSASGLKCWYKGIEVVASREPVLIKIGVGFSVYEGIDKQVKVIASKKSVTIEVREAD